jgi:hypothetical protein
MADADLRDGATSEAPAARRCSGCGKSVADDLRYCPSCGRFVPGSRRPVAGVATGAGVALGLALGCLVVAGYIWAPVVGFAAEAAVWGYVILAGDWSVSGRRVLIGTGIGVAVLAVLAVAIRIAGVGG